METETSIPKVSANRADFAQTARAGELDRQNPSRVMHICLLGLTLDSPNLGVGALLEGSIRGILTCYPNANLSILDYGYEPCEKSFEFDDRPVLIDFVNLRFSKKFYLTNNIAYLILLSAFLRYVMPARVRQYFIERNSTLRHISNIDIAASIAGGDSFSDIYGLSRLLYEALPQILVLMMGKKLIFLPQTLGPFKGRLARWIAGFVMSRADTVYSRDYAGMKEAQRLLNEKDDSEKIRFCFDLGFLVEPKKPDILNLNGLRIHSQAGGACLVGLNVSGLLYAGGYNRKNMFGLTADYKQTVERVVKVLIEEKRAIVILVPHVNAEPTGGEIESDDYACGQVYAEMKLRYPGRIYLVQGKYSSPEIKYIIGMCNVFIGSRMHACIAALSQGIPAVAISYSDKFAGVMETLGMSGLVADPRKMQIQEIVDVISHVLDDRESLSHQLSSLMPRVKDQTLAALNNLVCR